MWKKTLVVALLIAAPVFFIIAEISEISIPALAVSTQYKITSAMHYTTLTDDQISQYNLSDESVLVLAPVLTSNAYKQNGFYDYFRTNCDERCLTVEIDPDISFDFGSSKYALDMFRALDATILSDYDMSLNPDIIFDYGSVIVLHNEYVTKEMFDALQMHDRVFYMYPNALYADIIIDDGNMTLVRGHNYPEKEIINGFDWKFENTHPDEYDRLCEDYRWNEIDNGYQLNCYPEKVLSYKPEILFSIIEKIKT